MEKFNETSDVLNAVDWTPAPEKYLVYAMLKKISSFSQLLTSLNRQNSAQTEQKLTISVSTKTAKKFCVKLSM